MYGFIPSREPKQRVGTKDFSASTRMTLAALTSLFYLAVFSGSTSASPERNWYVILGSYDRFDVALSKQTQLNHRGIRTRMVDSSRYNGFASGYNLLLLGPYSKQEALRRLQGAKEVVGDAYIKDASAKAASTITTQNDAAPESPPSGSSTSQTASPPVHLSCKGERRTFIFDNSFKELSRYGEVSNDFLTLDYQRGYMHIISGPPSHLYDGDYQYSVDDEVLVAAGNENNTKYHVKLNRITGHLHIDALLETTNGRSFDIDESECNVAGNPKF